MRRRLSQGEINMSRFMRSLRLGLVPGLFVLGIAGTAIASDGWLGVETQSVTEDLRDALDLRGDGVLVNRVVDGSPAERAGIRKGDIIVSVNGHNVESPSELSSVIRGENSGASASVRVYRRGNGTQTFNVRLGSRPQSDDEDRGTWEDTPTPAPGHSETHTRVFKDGKEVDPEDFDFEVPKVPGFPAPGNSRSWSMYNRPRLGVRLQEMNSDLGGYFGGTNGRGALVVEVVEDTPAEKAGIKPGDVIIAVGNTNIDDTDDLIRAIADEEGNTSLTIVRRGVRRTIEVDLGDAPRRSNTWRMRDGRAPRAPRAPVAPKQFNDSDVDSRREIEELREEIRELKKQLEDKDR